MKNYKVIMPIVLAALMALSCFTVVQNAVSTSKEYKSYIKQAQAAAEKKITVDMDEAYQNALNINNNLDAYIEWGSYYYKSGDYDTATTLGETMVDTFPKEADAFVFLLKCYAKSENYDDFFSEYEHAKTLGAVNDKLKALYAKYQYVFELDYGSYLSATSFSGGYSVVSEETDDGVRYGYLSESGNEISPVYLKAGYFNTADEAVAPVTDQNNESYYITTDGNRKYVVEPKNINVVELGVYLNERVTVYDGKSYYLCDIEGNIVAGPYEYISAVNGGLCVASENGKWFIMDTDGKKVGSNQYEGFIIDEKNIAFRNAFFAKISGAYYLVDENGKKISDTAYEDAHLFIDGAAAVKKDGKWGFINEKGKTIVDFIYVNARSFSNGLAAVCEGNKWGYIALSDKNDVINAIECQFDGATDFSRSSHTAMVAVGLNWKRLALYN